MKSHIGAFVLAALFLLAGLAAFAQDRGRPAEASPGASAPAPSSSAGSVATRGIGGGVVSSGSSGAYYSAPMRDIGMSAAGGASTPIYTAPVFTWTSFTPYNYYRAMYFFDYLRSHYYWEMMGYGRYDLNRYYRNREPLITPDLVHMTLREPLAASERLLAAVDELQALIEDRQAGKPADKAEFEARTQEIRGLAKQIRQSQPISFFDLRKSRDLTKGIDNSMGLGAISQLREMALQLNSQLKSMYDQKVTSTVSVNSLSQASFESLSKGIEKLAKVIENSKPRS